MQIDGQSMSTVTVPVSPGTTIGLNPKRAYTFYHRGLNAALAAATGAIMVGLNGATPDGGEGLNKGYFPSQMVAQIGPGVSMVSAIAASGSPTFQITTQSSDV